jgi:hypothetical protein
MSNFGVIATVVRPFNVNAAKFRSCCSMLHHYRQMSQSPQNFEKSFAIKCRNVNNKSR